MLVFGIFLVRIQSEYGKIWTRKTPNSDSFTRSAFEFVKKTFQIKSELKPTHSAVAVILVFILSSRATESLFDPLSSFLNMSKICVF